MKGEMIVRILRRITTPLALCMLAATSGCLSTAGIAPTALAPTPGPAAPQVLLAALDGGLVGRAGDVPLSGADRVTALQSEYRALEYAAPGNLVTWQAQTGAVTGEVIASQPYRVGSQDCRQYTHTLSTGVGGEPTVLRGAACRNPDGSWTLLT